MSWMILEEESDKDDATGEEEEEEEEDEDEDSYETSPSYHNDKENKENESWTQK